MQEQRWGVLIGNAERILKNEISLCHETRHDTTKFDLTPRCPICGYAIRTRAQQLKSPGFWRMFGLLVFDEVFGKQQDNVSGQTKVEAGLGHRLAA
jgi:hypothetical protein